MNGEELVTVRLALPSTSALLLRVFAKHGGDLAVRFASEHCDPATSPEDLRPPTLEAVSDVATALIVRQIGEELDALERGELEAPLLTAIMNRDELRRVEGWEEVEVRLPSGLLAGLDRIAAEQRSKEAGHGLPS